MKHAVSGVPKACLNRYHGAVPIPLYRRQEDFTFVERCVLLVLGGTATAGMGNVMVADPTPVAKTILGDAVFFGSTGFVVLDSKGAVASEGDDLTRPPCVSILCAKKAGADKQGRAYSRGKLVARRKTLAAAANVYAPAFTLFAMHILSEGNTGSSMCCGVAGN